jgi:hypothetical protein
MTIGIVRVAFLAATAAGVGHPVKSALSMAILDDDVLALDPPQLAQPLPECFDVTGVKARRATGEITYAVGLFRRLRLGRDRRERETDSENNREPYQPHGHLVVDGWRGV